MAKRTERERWEARVRARQERESLANWRIQQTINQREADRIVMEHEARTVLDSWDLASTSEVVVLMLIQDGLILCADTVTGEGR